MPINNLISFQLRADVLSSTSFCFTVSPAFFHINLETFLVFHWNRIHLHKCEFWGKDSWRQVAHLTELCTDRGGVTFKITIVVIRLQFRRIQQSRTKYSLSGQNTLSLVYQLSWFFLRTLLNRQAIPHPIGLGMLCLLPGRMGNICPGSVASPWSLLWGDLTLQFSNLEIQVDLKSL